MKTIKLQATGFEFEVPDNYFYHDDGVVRSIANHGAKIVKRYKAQYDEFIKSVADHNSDVYKRYKAQHKYNYKQRLREIKRKIPGLSWLFGDRNLFFGAYLNILPKGYFKLSDALKDQQEVHAYIFVLGGYSKSELIQSKGHEETHVLLDHNQGSLLEKGLAGIVIGNDGFRELPEEAKCDLGGIFAVIRNNPFSKLFSGMPKNKKILSDYFYRNSNWGLK